MKKAIIYHMNNVTQRQACLERDLRILRLYAKEHNLEIVAEYIDTNQTKTDGCLNELLTTDLDYDVVLMKFGYYISRSTSQFLTFRKQLLDRDVKIITTAEGEL